MNLITQIPKTILIVLLILALQFDALSQASGPPINFSFTPEMPKPGEYVTITYSPPSEFPLNDIVQANIFSLLQGGPPTTQTLNLVRKKSVYEGIFRPADSVKGVFISFKSNNFEDNNNDKGYYFPLYKHDTPVPDAFILIARAFGPYSSTIGIRRQPEKVIQYMKKEFDVNPSSIEKHPLYYLRTLVYFRKPYSKEIQMFLTTIEKQGIDAELVLAEIQNYFTVMGEIRKADEIQKKIEIRFPNGSWLKKKRLIAFENEKNFIKKVALYEDYAKQFPPKSQTEKEVFDDDFTWELMVAFAKAGDYNKVAEYSKRMYTKEELAGVYHAIAQDLVGLYVSDISRDLKKANSFNEMALQILESIPNSKDSITHLYQNIDRTKALILYREGYFSQAYDLHKKVVNETYGKIAFINEALSTYAEEAVGVAEAQKVIEPFVKKGIYTMAMKDQLKRIYLLSQPEKDWNTYITLLDKDHLQKTRDELFKRKINEPMPSFSLKNLKGEVISLESLKGKILVLDFWATWCGPCIIRFPGMMATMEKYKNNPDVVFLFVNTLESTTPNRLQRIRTL